MSEGRKGKSRCRFCAGGVISGKFVLTALHLILFPNPMLTSAMLLVKERAKAANARSRRR